MAHGHASLGQLLTTHIDGIPLETAASLLPLRTRLRSGLYTHIHLHAKTQQRFADAADDKQATTSAKAPRISKKALRAILESLASTVQKLVWQPPKTEWGSYYEATNYSAGAADNKAALIGEMLAAIERPITVCHDLGANRGLYSEVAAQHCAQVITQDIDPVAVESQYRERKTRGPDNILPLLQDLTAPSPAIGWRNRERDGFTQRAQCDAVLALALVHHLAISNNTPLSEIAGFFAAHEQEGTWAGGIHVELTGDSVTECVGGGDDLQEAALDQAYETMCDPRLNGRQSVDLAFMVAELLRQD